MKQIISGLLALLIAPAALSADIEYRTKKTDNSHLIIHNNSDEIRFYLDGMQKMLATNSGIFINCIGDELFEIQIGPDVNLIPCGNILDIDRK